MKNFHKRLAGLSLGLFLSLGVAAAVGHQEVTSVKASSDISQYSLITSDSDLEVGKSYIFTNGTTGTVKAIANTENTNNRKSVDATVEDGKITRGSDILSVTLGGSSEAWTFQTENYGGTAGYFASAGTDKNYLLVQDTAGTATISFSDSKATIVLGPHESRNVLLYNGTTSGTTTYSLFACYALTNVSDKDGNLNDGYSLIYMWKEVEVAPTTSKVTSIALTEQTTEYYVGDNFAFTGKCTATYEDGGNGLVNPTSVTAPDMSTTGEKEVTVSYTDPNDATNIKTATYKINVINYTGKGTIDSPFTVKDAVHKAGQAGSTATTDAYYVKGEIKKVTTDFDSKYGNMTFTVGDGTTDETFTFYRCVAGNEIKFTEETAKSIVVGETIVGYGKILKYGTTCEFDSGCYPVDYAITSITASSPTVTEFEVGAKISSLADLGVTLTANVPVTGEVRDLTAQASVEEKTLVLGENTINVSYTQANKYTGDKTGYTALETTVTIQAVETPHSKANVYANTFLEKTDAICGDGKEEKTGEALEALKTAWNELKTSYDALDTDVKQVLVNAEAKNDGTAIEKAMARHDHIVTRYGLEKIVADRTITSSTQNLFANSNSNLTITIIVLVSVLSVSLIIGTTLIIRKRKVN